MMNNAVTAPAFSSPLDCAFEHAWVLEPAGSQLITARSNITLHYDAGYMSEHRLRSTIKRLTVRRRPYMSNVSPLFSPTADPV